jgi:acetate kinase
MEDYALVLNAGSSSLKFSVYRRPEVEAWRLEARASKVSAWVIPTNEELMIARHTGTLLGLTGGRT